MRRMGVVACVVAVLALPGVAAPPRRPPTCRSARPVGSRTSSMRATGRSTPRPTPPPPAVRPEPQGALWRSGDGGRTWSSRYRARSGAQVRRRWRSPRPTRMPSTRARSCPRSGRRSSASTPSAGPRDPAADDAPAGRRRRRERPTAWAPDWCAARAAPTPAMRCRCPCSGSTAWSTAKSVGVLASHSSIRHGGRRSCRWSADGGGDLDAGRPALARLLRQVRRRLSPGVRRPRAAHAVSPPGPAPRSRTTPG